MKSFFLATKFLLQLVVANAATPPFFQEISRRGDDPGLIVYSNPANGVAGNLNTFDWTRFETTFLSESTSMTMVISSRHDPAFWGFDGLSITAAGSNVNLLINGGFESGNINPWYPPINNGFSQVEIGAAFEGTYLFSAGNVEVPETISQDVTLVSCVTYTVSGYVKADDCPAGQGACVVQIILNGLGSLPIPATACVSTTSASSSDSTSSTSTDPATTTSSDTTSATTPGAGSTSDTTASPTSDTTSILEGGPTSDSTTSTGTGTGTGTSTGTGTGTSTGTSISTSAGTSTGTSTSTGTAPRATSSITSTTAGATEDLDGTATAASVFDDLSQITTLPAPTTTVSPGPSGPANPPGITGAPSAAAPNPTVVPPASSPISSVPALSTFAIRLQATLAVKRQFTDTFLRINAAGQVIASQSCRGFTTLEISAGQLRYGNRVVVAPVSLAVSGGSMPLTFGVVTSDVPLVSNTWATDSRGVVKWKNPSLPSGSARTCLLNGVLQVVFSGRVADIPGCVEVELVTTTAEICLPLSPPEPALPAIPTIPAIPTRPSTLGTPPLFQNPSATFSSPANPAIIPGIAPVIGPAIIPGTNVIPNSPAAIPSGGLRLRPGSSGDIIGVSVIVRVCVIFRVVRVDAAYVSSKVTITKTISEQLCASPGVVKGTAVQCAQCAVEGASRGEITQIQTITFCAACATTSAVAAVIIPCATCSAVPFTLPVVVGNSTIVATPASVPAVPGTYTGGAVVLSSLGAWSMVFAMFGVVVWIL